MPQAAVGRQRVERLIESATRQVPARHASDQARGSRHLGVVDGGLPGESADIFCRVILSWLPARVLAVVEDAAQQFRQLGRQMRRYRNRQPIPKGVHPGSGDAIGEAPVIGTELASHLREPGGGLVNAVIEIAHSGVRHDSLPPEALFPLETVCRWLGRKAFRPIGDQSLSPARPGTGEHDRRGEATAVGIARRVAELYEVKINALLDRAEDPREMLDYSYARQQDYLQEMREAAVDLGASRKRAAGQEGDLRRSADRLRTQAEQAVAAGHDELGRDALRLRSETIAHADDLAAEQAQLRADQERLTEATRRLEARLRTLAYQKEALKAAYTAAEAQAAAEAAVLFGGTREAADAERRAAEHAEGLQARADALSEQADRWQQPAPGTLAADRIQEQLDAVSREAAVQEELARIKEQVGSAAEKREPDAGVQAP